MKTPSLMVVVRCALNSARGLMVEEYPFDTMDECERFPMTGLIAKPNMTKVTPEKIESLRQELTQIRQASLHATRKGDFMRVARLTPKAAQINKAIMDAEAQILADL